MDALTTLFSFGVVKAVYRGTSASSGTATITAVNTSKTYVDSKSKGSAGYVAATGNVSLAVPTGSVWDTGTTTQYAYGGSSASGQPGWPPYSGSISGGSTNLTVREYSAVLTNSTTVTFDGPVEWQVIEYY